MKTQAQQMIQEAIERDADAQSKLTKIEIDPEKFCFINLADNALLAAVARGEIDLNQMAKQVLASRGMDKNCVWRGFEKARELLDV